MVAAVAGLAERHRRALCDERALPAEVVAERGYRTITDPAELLELGFADYQARTAPVLLIPLHGLDGSNGRYAIKPDRPRIGKDGKTRKYDYPAGWSHMLDVPPRCLHSLRDAGVPLMFTEGAPKADCGAGLGYCTIDIWGTSSWYTNPQHGGFATIEPLEDWQAILDTLDGRLCYLAYDSDAWRNPNVARELRRLANWLARQGALVYIVHLPDEPDGTKNGLDDFVARYGAEAFRQLVDDAEPWGSTGVVRQLQAELRELRQERSAIFGVLHNEHLSAEQRIVAVGTVCDIEARASHGSSDPLVITVGTLDDGSPEHRRFGLAGLLGFGRNTVSRALRAICADGSPIKKETVRTLHDGEWRSAIRLTRTTGDSKLGVLRAFATFDPDPARTKARHGGKRPRCPDHPDALLIRREVLLHFGCGCVVAEVDADALSHHYGASDNETSAIPDFVRNCTNLVHQDDLGAAGEPSAASIEHALMHQVGASDLARHIVPGCERTGSWRIGGQDLCDTCWRPDGTPRPPPDLSAGAGRAA